MAKRMVAASTGPIRGREALREMRGALRRTAGAPVWEAYEVLDL